MIYTDKINFHVKYDSLTVAANADLEQIGFEDEVFHICEGIVEKGNALQNDDELNQALYLMLNIYPSFNETKERLAKYRSVYMGRKAMLSKILKAEIIHQYNRLIPVVKQLGLCYVESKQKIAEMHFFGNLGNGSLIDKPRNILEKYPFSFDEYLQLRNAVTIEDIRNHGSWFTKLSFLRILIAYYLEAYFLYTVEILADADVVVFIPPRVSNNPDVAKKMQYAVNELGAGVDSPLNADVTNRAELSVKEKSNYLYDFCKTQYGGYGNNNNLRHILDSMGKDCGIGKKRCNGLKFAQICYLVLSETKILKSSKFTDCQRFLAFYYRIEPTAYKINQIQESAKLLYEEDIDVKEYIDKLKAL